MSMRLSTTQFYSAGTSRISALEQSLLRTQQQIATGRRILTPADDPVAAARALEVTQSQSVNTQFGNNRGTARDSLSLEESTLQGVTSLLQDVQTQVVHAGNAVLNDTDRKSIATDLQQRLDELIGLANTRDGSGSYLFSGYSSATASYVATATGALYGGDQGQHLIQVGNNRQIALSDSGNAVFENYRTGNGTFNVTPTIGNTGSGVVTPGSVVDYSALNGDYYDVRFQVISGVTTYDVYDTTAGGAALSTGNAFISGTPITFGGMQIAISGAPANGDSFSTAPSTSQSVFTTLKSLITALNTPVTGTGSNAALLNSLTTAGSELSGALDNVLTVRASVGSRLNELDSLDSIGDNTNILYKPTLSDLQDVDYNKAISDLTQNQTILDAAQKSFLKISGLSLFNLM